MTLNYYAADRLIFLDANGLFVSAA